MRALPSSTTIAHPSIDGYAITEGPQSEALSAPLHVPTPSGVNADKWFTFAAASAWGPPVTDQTTYLASLARV